MFKVQVKKIDSSIHTNDGSFLQTPFWCEFKARHGWTYRRFALNIEYEDAQNDFEVSVLNRDFAKGKFSIAYIPLFPKLPFDTKQVSANDQTIEFAAFLHDIAIALKEFLPSNTIAIRFDPDVSFDDLMECYAYNKGLKIVSFADKLGLRKNRVDIQPPDTTLVDLTRSLDEIMEGMHSKWRYNIRLSAKKGVVIHKYDGKSLNLSEKIDKFYELTKETNARDGNSSHAKEYYLDLIRSSAQECEEGKDVPQINLYIAEHEGDEIAAIMTLFSHDEAIYLYGASSNHKRNLMPNHLLQWTAMQDAKAYGSKYYDMYGMPPEGQDENHPMHGLYMFKANFGGRIIHRLGSWDMPLRPVYYKLYSMAEGARAFWFKKIVKKLHGR